MDQAVTVGGVLTVVGVGVALIIVLAALLAILKAIGDGYKH